MAIELPKNQDVLDALVSQRLASLDDPELAGRLARDNPSLYSAFLARTELAARRSTQRRRFGSIALALTAAASIAAGFIMMPLLGKHATPAPAAAPVRHTAAKIVPIPVHHDAALQTKIRQQDIELARLRAQVAAEQAARARAAAAAAVVIAAPAVPVRRHAAAALATVAHHATASTHHAAPVQHAAAPAVRHAAAPAHAAVTGPLPSQRTDPQSQTQEQNATQTPAQASVDPNVPVATNGGNTSQTTAQGPLPIPDGTKAGPPSSGGHVPWGGRPGPFGGGAGGGVDPCTPRGGRMGVVLQTIVNQAVNSAVRGAIHF